MGQRASSCPAASECRQNRAAGLGKLLPALAESGEVPYAPTQAVRALKERSPPGADAVAQLMADPLAMRASMPEPGWLAGGGGEAGAGAGAGAAPGWRPGSKAYRRLELPEGGRGGALPYRLLRTACSRVLRAGHRKACGLRDGCSRPHPALCAAALQAPRPEPPPRACFARARRRGRWRRRQRAGGATRCAGAPSWTASLCRWRCCMGDGLSVCSRIGERQLSGARRGGHLVCEFPRQARVISCMLVEACE